MDINTHPSSAHSLSVTDSRCLADWFWTFWDFVGFAEFPVRGFRFIKGKPRKDFPALCDWLGALRLIRTNEQPTDPDSR